MEWLQNDEKVYPMLVEGKMQNDVHVLAYDEHATEIVNAVARSQYKRRTRAFDELAILYPKDLSQEIWAELTSEQNRGRFLSIFVSSDGDFKDYLDSLCNKIAMKGRRIHSHGHSIPMAALNKRDISNLWHRSGRELEATFDEIFERQDHWG